MANIPMSNGVNIPPWKALMSKFRGEDDAAEEFSKASASELDQLLTRDEMHAALRGMELRLVRWMIAIGALIIAANAIVVRLT